MSSGLSLTRFTFKLILFIGEQEGLQSFLDETWGLDNVSVTPEPATLFLLGLGGVMLRRISNPDKSEQVEIHLNDTLYYFCFFSVHPKISFLADIYIILV